MGSFGQLGPLTLEQMEELIEGGVIERDTYVWQSGMSEWIQATHAYALESALNQKPPTNLPPPFDPRQPSPPQPSRPVATQIPPQYGGPFIQSGSGQNVPAYRPTQTNPAQFAQQMHPYVPKSNMNRTLAGILQIIPGVGRMYLGYTALGAIQLVLCCATCGLLWIWSLIDGVLILSGQVRYDGFGRSLDN